MAVVVVVAAAVVAGMSVAEGIRVDITAEDRIAGSPGATIPISSWRL
jgi:hypothetical protein